MDASLGLISLYVIVSSFFVSFNVFRALLILVVVVSVGSWSSRWYVLVSLSRFVALEMYSAGSMTIFSSFFRLMRTCLSWSVKRKNEQRANEQTQRISN